MEADWPGLWRIWEVEQIVTLGWPPGWNWHWDGSGKRKPQWTEVRNKVNAMKAGDLIVARLPDHRIGRIGQIVEKRVEDNQWEEAVPVSPELDYGEQGRRILVRWDFSIGPRDRDYACTLPQERQFSTGGKRRKTVLELEVRRFNELKRALMNEATWAPAFADRFAYERALSDYIATFPERLESGMRPYPMAKVREQICSGRDRLDVLLQDESGRPVVVECKQDSASVAHLDQLRGYMRIVKTRTGMAPRGVLVFGGSPNVASKVRSAAKKQSVELVAYRLDVSFLKGK